MIKRRGSGKCPCRLVPRQPERFADIPGASAFGERLGSEFESCFEAANYTARLKMGTDAGDPQATVEKMQTSLKTLTIDLDATTILGRCN